MDARVEAGMFDAVIVGGGPAGSTAAILLAQAGWSVALVEKSAFPRRKVCGECISATNLPLLHALGIGAAFEAMAGPQIREVALFAGKAVLTAPLPPFGDPRHPWGRALGREHLDSLLLARAAEAGATILQPCAIKRIAREGAVHRCDGVDANGETIALRARVTIAAHGSWEPDPSWQETRLPHRASDLFACKATYRDTRLVPGLLPVLAFPGGYGGIVLGDHDRTTLAFCIRRDALRESRRRHSPRNAALAALAHVRTHCAGVRDALEGAEADAPWLSVGPIQPGIRRPWRADGMFAVGNVAGEAHPILGEGMSMAIQSAWLLCERLIAGSDALLAGDASERARVAVGADYAAAWRRSFIPRIRLAAVLAHLAMRPRASGVLLPLLRRWPWLLTSGARAGGKVSDLAIRKGRTA